MRATEHKQGKQGAETACWGSQDPTSPFSPGLKQPLFIFSQTEGVGGRKACEFPDRLSTLASAIPRKLRNIVTRFLVAQKHGHTPSDLQIVLYLPGPACLQMLTWPQWKLRVRRRAQGVEAFHITLTERRFRCGPICHRVRTRFLECISQYTQVALQ